MKYATFITEKGDSFNTAAWKMAISTVWPVGAPEVQTSYLEIPGNTPLDTTEALTGAPVYTHREIQFTCARTIAPTDWPDFVRQVMAAVHGVKCRITFSDDPDTYYVGRVQVQDIDRKGWLGYMTFSVPMAEPYGYQTVATGTLSSGQIADTGEPGIWFLVSNSADMTVTQSDGTTCWVPGGIEKETYSPTGTLLNNSGTVSYEARRHVL